MSFFRDMVSRDLDSTFLDTNFFATVVSINGGAPIACDLSDVSANVISQGNTIFIKKLVVKTADIADVEVYENGTIDIDGVMWIVMDKGEQYGITELTIKRNGY